MRKLSMIGQMKKEAERDFTKFVKYVAELEEENKKLKEERDSFKEQAILWRKDWKVAYEEKRKLEERLDNKEKVNISMREELEKLKSTYVYDAKQVRDVL